MFIIDSVKSLESVRFEVLGREAGPEIVFYPSGLIKSYYNYGFDKSDISLPMKTKKVKLAIEESDMILETYFPYYKMKNGIEYHFDEKGKMKKKIFYKDDEIVKTEDVN